MSTDLTTLSGALRDIPPEKLPHGIEQYKRFGPKTVLAILAVRDLVVHSADLSETTFRIGLTADPEAQEVSERRAGCVKFQIIFESVDRDEARIVEADTTLNFLWHFPGRCLNKAEHRAELTTSEGRLFVYLACFPRSVFVVPGKA